MARRSYDQYCGLAAALDLIGARWSLLVVRELMTGPKRYTDLAESLRGIGTSLLATRLKELETHGILERAWLAPPAASTVYRLTGKGDELAHALMPLMQWGLRHAVPEEPEPDTLVRAEWALLAITHGAAAGSLDGVDATYEFIVDGTSAVLRVVDGRASVAGGEGEGQPDVTVRLAAATVAAIGSGRVSVADATKDGRLTFQGDPAAIETLVAMLAPTR